MKKKFLYMLTALLAVSATSCKDDDLMGVGSAVELDRMPRTVFCTQESTGDDKTSNVHCITEELNAIYLSWFKIKDAAGYHIRYGLQSGLTSGLLSDWDKNRSKEIYIGENVMSVLSEDIKSKAKIIDHIESLEDLRQIGDKDEYVIVCQDLNEFHLYNLPYGEDFRFAIQTLSPRGPEHDSEWYGMGNGQHWAEQCGQGTEERYPQPQVLTYTARGDNSIDVYVNLRSKDAMDGMTQEEITSYKSNFGWSADSTLFEADMIRVVAENEEASLDQKWKDGVPLSEFDFVNGSANIRIDNLSPNTTYFIDVVNSKVPVSVDATYNNLSLRTSGQRGEPILIKHTWEADTNLVAAEYKVCRIDTILRHFMDDSSLAEGQVFYLEGGKTYYFAQSINMYKGFTLETNPDDVKKGLRAQVYMGGLTSTKGNKNIGTVGQLVLGRPKKEGESADAIIIEKIAFNNIDFSAPAATNFGTGSATGNYFVNMLSNGIGVTFDSFEVRNCTFQGLIRGFFRVQGSRVKIFNRIIVDNCVFYNCGYYSANGNSYAMFAGDGKSAKSNLWGDFRFTNNTIYDSPWVNLFTDGNKKLAWAESIKYNIRIENNTFINFNTRASGRYILALRYMPSGSFISFKNNLIALAADDRDIRELNCNWGDVREIVGTTGGVPQATFDVENNYSVGCRDSHLKVDGIWTAAAISATKNSLGKLWNATPGLLQSGPDHSLGDGSLKVQVGKVALLSTELFANPNPPYFAHDPNVPNPKDHIAPANIFEALRIVPSGRCPADHEIVANKIGAPRWYTSDPEHFTLD